MLPAKPFTGDDLAEPAATLGEQLPDVDAGVPGHGRMTVLVRVLRRTPKGALLAAPHPASRSAWVSLARVTIADRRGDRRAAWPLHFASMPLWLYRGLRLELLGLPSNTPPAADPAGGLTPSACAAPSPRP